LGIRLFMGAVTVGWWQVRAETGAIVYILATFVVLLTTIFPVLVVVNVSEPLTGAWGGHPDSSLEARELSQLQQELRLNIWLYGYS
jgi:hypothetical protein